MSAKAAYGDKNAPKKATPGPNNANANQQAGSGRRDQFPGRMGQGRKVLQEEITDGQGKDNTKRNAGQSQFCISGPCASV